MRQKDILDPSGHLEIYKIYENGTEEQVFGDHNVITSGMGVGLGLLYAGSGATDITNFQIKYFQLGVSGDSIVNTYGVSEVSLVSALGQQNGISDYKTVSPLPIVSGELMSSNGAPLTTVGGSYLDSWYFGLISENSIKRVDLNSVTYIIYIDRNSCNGNTLNEIGLFMQNPLGLTPHRSPLVAYRPFVNIPKISDFALVFKWTLNF
jgi:hypothetical protein